MAASPEWTGIFPQPPSSVHLVRAPGVFPPDYVCDSAMGQMVDSPFFTLELEHGGLFRGAIDDMEYFNHSVEEAQIQEWVELVDESYDDPTFLQNIFPEEPDPRLDPTESPTSMVFNMSQRELAKRAP
ncbi:hypothetical protein ZWY2020_036404 [Hordeum vulgare]|nr:hypothetical protein ZWY2020_036404 [Hordeum vulgare]